MEDFTYHNPVRMIFGNDAHDHLAEELKRVGAKRILIHYGSDRIKKSGLYDRVVDALKSVDAEHVSLGGVVPNPRLDLVKEGVELCKKEGVDFILAVGGGSVIDSAKAIAMGFYEDDVWDLYRTGRQPRNALPLGTILTIPAAGSEFGRFTVITNIETKQKLGYGSEKVYPRFSLLDPKETMTLPAYQTACGAADMLAHTLERYFVRVKHVDVTDRMLEGVMKAIIRNVQLVLQEPDNYDYRAELMWAGSVAHNGWLNTGRTNGDWASHGIEHELSAEYDIAHGAGLAIVFPAWMKHVYKEDTKRFALWAENVWGIVGYDEEESARLAIAALENFFKSIGLPTRMSDADIGPEKISDMAKNALWKGGLGSFKRLTEKDVEAIYRLAK